MVDPAATLPPAIQPRFASPLGLKGSSGLIVLLIGYGIMLVPTLMRLAEQSWTMDIGAHGPIVLVTGLWLLWHVRDELRAKAGSATTFWPLAVGAMLCATTYAFGRSLDLLVFEVGAAYGMMLLIAARFIGVRGILANAFPFIYLAFLVPPPGWVIDTLTSPLREWISVIATALLAYLDFPVAREGIVITIGGYQLLVEDACSGMNSLIGLSAISIFYIYIIHRANWRHALLLIAAVIPIAMAANLIRVIALILITHYFGDAVAQGFVHNFAGITLFALALALMVATDWVLFRFMRRTRPTTAGEP
jgi:exosortase